MTLRFIANLTLGCWNFSIEFSNPTAAVIIAIMLPSLTLPSSTAGSSSPLFLRCCFSAISRSPVRSRRLTELHNFFLISAFHLLLEMEAGVSADTIIAHSSSFRQKESQFLTRLSGKLSLPNNSTHMRNFESETCTLRQR